MQVEIYECTTDEALDAEDQERQVLLSDLGLSVEQQVESAIPFPELSSGEMRVYQTLFHVTNTWEKYPGYLPTRVLRTIKAYKENFAAVEVWSDQKSDPVLVGRTKKHSDDGCFLLARWGTAIEPFETLREKAIAIWTEKRRGAINALIARLNADAVAHFNGEWVTAYL